jgi:signal transduction histidine kinase
MSIGIARTITNSVRILEDTTRRIAEGDLDLNVEIKGSNEITSLTNSLNKMRNALKEEELRRSRFIMGISHDLKTPLALIKGYAEAIEDGVAEDSASRSGAAEIIITKADQLEGMINDLINYVRLETGQWRNLLAEINITSFLNGFVKTLTADVQLLHHEFVSNIDLPENINIRMDEKLVFRALENLVNNAVRHTPDGSVIRLGASLNKNAVKIEIADNGPGIEKEALPYVFDMFYRASSSRREQGMGLGLAVVKWVADYHGWTVSASSGKEKGAVFTIIIPFD